MSALLVGSVQVDWERLIRAMEKEAKSRNAPVFTLKNFLKTPFQILVFAILSSRTRDEQTVEVTRRLFQRVNAPEDLLKMDILELEEILKGVGFYRVKARTLKSMAEKLVYEFNCEVPRSFDDLIKLPGVGRKVANIILADAFNEAAIGVDTHVHRISNRLGLISTKKPEETEEELRKIVPVKLWNRVNKAFVGFGQTVCRPQKPLCNQCPLEKLCPKIGVK
jgi:endonuclease-3